MQVNPSPDPSGRPQPMSKADKLHAYDHATGIPNQILGHTHTSHGASGAGGAPSAEYTLQQQLPYNIGQHDGTGVGGTSGVGTTGGPGATGTGPDPSDGSVVAAAAAAAQNAAARGYGAPPPVTGGASPTQKPMVGSEEYYKIKKDNHKEVERRRRETINRGIEELAKVVPDCDRHKGQILARTIEYIRKLKDAEQQYMEKLTLEKLLNEQAVTELTNTNKSLRAELQIAWKEIEHYKRQAANNAN